MTDAAGHEGLSLCYGEVVVPTRYDSVNYYTSFGVPRENILVIASRDGRDYLVNHLGEEVFSADEIMPNEWNICPAMFKEGGKWGRVNRKGEVLIPAEYDSIEPDAMGAEWLKRDGKMGFIMGGDVVEPKFDNIEVDADGFFVGTINGVSGYIGEGGELITDEDEDSWRYGFEFG